LTNINQHIFWLIDQLTRMYFMPHWSREDIRTLGNPPKLFISRDLAVYSTNPDLGIQVPPPYRIVQRDPRAALEILQQTTNLARLGVALSPTLACTDLNDRAPKPDESHRTLVSHLFTDAFTGLSSEEVSSMPIFGSDMQWVLREAHFETFLRNAIEREPFRYWDRIQGSRPERDDVGIAVRHIQEFDKELFGEIDNILGTPNSHGNYLFEVGRIGSYALETLKLLLLGVIERRDPLLCATLMAPQAQRHYFVLQSYHRICRKVGPECLKYYRDHLQQMYDDMNRFAPQAYREELAHLLEEIPEDL
jgi:hypothetical protein